MVNYVAYQRIEGVILHLRCPRNPYDGPIPSLSPLVVPPRPHGLKTDPSV